MSFSKLQEVLSQSQLGMLICLTIKTNKKSKKNFTEIWLFCKMELFNCPLQRRMSIEIKKPKEKSLREKLREMISPVGFKLKTLRS